ncbi:MAG: hypothetical protein H9W82_07575, partial [Lactobacillus sp.]|nr:hypothetical protein [Lactobacillus sp.]
SNGLPTIDVKIDYETLRFPIADLTEREKALIDLCIQKRTKNIDKNSRWYQILFEKKRLVDKGSYRIIHITIHSSQSFNEKSWKAELCQMFTGAVDLFSIGKLDYVLIEQQLDSSFKKREIEGICTALDNDFDIYSRLFIGEFFSYTTDFSKIYLEQKALFKKQLASTRGDKVFCTASSIIPFMLDSLSQIIIFYSTVISN